MISLLQSEFSECPFYPGQELKGHLDSLTDAKWIVATPRHCHRTTSKKGKSSTVVVKVEKVRRDYLYHY